MKWIDNLIDKAVERYFKSHSSPPDGTELNVACFDCGIKHELPRDARQAVSSAEGFFYRHSGHNVDWLVKPHIAGLWTPNADVKQAFQPEQTMTVTNLHSLASSATAGWQSAVVDNTSDLFMDSLVQVVLDFANTAPANSKGAFIFCYHGLSSTYTNPATGSEGTITLVDVVSNPQAMPLLGFLPYTTQDEVAESQLFSVALTSGGFMPPKWGVVIINYSGAALASSGNTVKYRGVYLTVV
jgi:hypothetical protein